MPPLKRANAGVASEAGGIALAFVFDWTVLAQRNPARSR